METSNVRAARTTLWKTSALFGSYATLAPPQEAPCRPTHDSRFSPVWRISSVQHAGSPRWTQRTQPHLSPTYQCVPEAGGDPVPCGPIEYEQAQARDALYAEAEAVYRRLDRIGSTLRFRITWK